MARLARMVVRGVAHRVTQRGNRRQQTFCEEDGYRVYLALLGEPAFLDRVERFLGRTARPATPRRKPKHRMNTYGDNGLLIDVPRNHKYVENRNIVIRAGIGVLDFYNPLAVPNDIVELTDLLRGPICGDDKPAEPRK